MRTPPAQTRGRPILAIALLTAGTFGLQAAQPLEWRQLAPLPTRLGVAGAFAGVSGDVLLVAGGANFPDRTPSDNGAKVWHDEVFILEKPDGAWRQISRLPQPLGYGVSVSHPRGLVCVGGSDARQHYAQTTLLRWQNGRLESETLASLPQPIANLGGALLGDTLFVAGGTVTPNASNALNTCYAMNLAEPKPAWRELAPFPGRGRIFAACGAAHGSFYVFSGAALKNGPTDKLVREWLRDACRYTPGEGWKRIADLPRVAVAAPCPAPLVGGRLLILGGDDGAQVNTTPSAHRGFRHDVLAYDRTADRWSEVSSTPFAQVTTSAVSWNDRIVIPSGEVRPRVRSPEVWSALVSP